MRALLVSLILIGLCSYSTVAQITFEKGYFIRTDGTRTECLIKNVDWKNNPTEFQYKTTDEKPLTAQIQDVTEFGVYGQSTYKILSVDIDRSVLKLDEISSRNPAFKKEILALRLLVDGTADLYYYEDSNLVRFFFAVGDGAVEQLVYKEYLFATSKIAKNEYFKQQIWLNVNCGDIPEARVKKLQYETDALVEYFRMFNNCSGDKNESLVNKPRRDLLNFKLVAGIGFSTLKVKAVDYLSVYEKRFENVSYHIGFEAEIILPFNKNKWAVLIEPTYNTFKGTHGKDSWGNEAHINTIEIAIGARHYFFLNNHSKIFLDAMVLSAIPVQEDIEYLELEAGLNYNAAIGTGISYNRLSAAFRYYPGYQMLKNYQYWSARQAKAMIILGYRLF